MRSHRLTFLPYFITPALLLCAFSTNAANENSSAQAGVTVTVNPSRTHAISPYIYGINFASKIDGVPSALTLDRDGRQSLDRLQLGNQRLERRQRLSI